MLSKVIMKEFEDYKKEIEIEEEKKGIEEKKRKNQKNQSY